MPEAMPSLICHCPCGGVAVAVFEYVPCWAGVQDGRFTVPQELADRLVSEEPGPDPLEGSSHQIEWDYAGGSEMLWDGQGGFSSGVDTIKCSENNLHSLNECTFTLEESNA